jgi:hypothetical protein
VYFEECRFKQQYIRAFVTLLTLSRLAEQRKDGKKRTGARKEAPITMNSLLLSGIYTSHPVPIEAY